MGACVIRMDRTEVIPYLDTREVAVLALAQRFAVEHLPSQLPVVQHLLHLRDIHSSYLVRWISPNLLLRCM